MCDVDPLNIHMRDVINTIASRIAAAARTILLIVSTRNLLCAKLRSQVYNGARDSITAGEKSRINSGLFITLETLAVIRHLFFILSSLAATTAAVADY